MFDEMCSIHCDNTNDNSVFKDAVLVLMNDLKMQDHRDVMRPITSNSVKRHMWSHVSEDKCKFGKNQTGRVNPMLKLYPNCPMMMTQNTDVANGQANGSRVRLL